MVDDCHLSTYLIGMAIQDHIDELVRRALLFDRLKTMGMIGSAGRYANAEACRRNSWIRTKQKELGISSKELEILKGDAIKNGEFH